MTYVLQDLKKYLVKTKVTEKKNAPSDKKLHSIVATLRKKGKEFLLTLQFLCLVLVPLFCKYFIKSTSWFQNQMQIQQN